MNTISTKWGPIIISALVVVIFGLVFSFVALKFVDDSSGIKDLLIGLFAQVQAVISYWLGSSAGSKAKDAIIAASPAVPSDQSEGIK